MKNITKFIILILVCILKTNAQATDLIGFSDGVIANLEIETNNLTQLNDPGTVSFFVGRRTFDPVNFRYIIATTTGILIIDANNGSIIKSIPNDLNIRNIVYDKVTGLLYGTYWNGSNHVLTSLNLDNLNITDIAILNGIQSFINAESTFDFTNRRLFLFTNLGVTIIDIVTGQIINSFSPTTPSGVNFRQIEYSDIDGYLYGIYKDGVDFTFAKIDLNNLQLIDINPLVGIQSVFAEDSTFDQINNLYFIRTNSGILKINTANGMIIESSQNSNLRRIEALYRCNLENESLNSIPTISEWGIIITLILLLIVATIAIQEKNRIINNTAFTNS